MLQRWDIMLQVMDANAGGGALCFSGGGIMLQVRDVPSFRVSFSPIFSREGYQRRPFSWSRLSKQRSAKRVNGAHHATSTKMQKISILELRFLMKLSGRPKM